MTQKKFLENDDQFIVSYELLYILQWLLMYEKEAFAKIVHSAFVKGSQNSNAKIIYDQIEETEHLQTSVVDFFSFLEREVESISEAESIKHIMQTNLLKTLDHIDPKLFDPITVKESMMITAEKIDHQRKSHAKELFLKELLKKWHPKKEKNKKHTLH